MAKPDEPDNLAWGTLEELLLACAVHRHGTNSWDSVAKEIQKRCSGTAFHLFTSLKCKQKYVDLKRRFAAQGGDGNAFPCLDELRRRRIAELKHELERYDLSIVSLQSKVKRLSEEREKSLTENEIEISDLQKTVEEEKPGTPLAPLPESAAPAEESDREKHSVNASNKSDPKEEDGYEVAGEDKPGADPPAKPTGEGSYNGSTETIAAAKGTAGSQDLGSAKSERVCDSPELVESVAESKREEEGVKKETSEVQSKGRRNSGDENQPDAGKPGSVKSQPLADFLDVIRRHKFGSVFERRLDSQESWTYKSMIREHIDLATVSRRVGEGQYTHHHSKFYRDLLLLATNAALFFPNIAPEHKAAIELRHLVTTKIPRHPSNWSTVVLKPLSGEKKRSDSSPLWFSAVTKKRTKDQSCSGAKMSGSCKSSSSETAAKLQKKMKNDKDNNSNATSSGGVKKKIVANFLDRIRKGSPESVKSGSNGNSRSNNKGGGEARNKGKQKEGGNDESSIRYVGRPPKRAAAMAGVGKRRREGGGADKAEVLELPKKRSRK